MRRARALARVRERVATDGCGALPDPFSQAMWKELGVKLPHAKRIVRDILQLPTEGAGAAVAVPAGAPASASVVAPAEGGGEGARERSL